MDTKLLYLVSGIITGIIFLVLLFVFIRKRRISNLKKQLEVLERQSNLIVGTPIMSELSKVEVILKNNKLENKLEDWKRRLMLSKKAIFQQLLTYILE
jgi:hypothetical protein